MNRQFIINLILLSMTLIVKDHCLLAQSKKQDANYRRQYIGSSLFLLANCLPDPPSFYQINYGYRLTRKDVVSLEAITWTYDAPLGIPYGSSHESPEQSYPGSIKGVGLGFAYQRFLWQNLYASIHATPLLQTYRNERKEKIQHGFQLFSTLRLGYHLPFFKNRFFLEPSVAATYWPVNTNMPQSFRAVESNWPDYFLFEPGLHFGIKF
jgi:hypothetical protein